MLSLSVFDYVSDVQQSRQLGQVQCQQIFHVLLSEHGGPNLYRSVTFLGIGGGFAEPPKDEKGRLAFTKTFGITQYQFALIILGMLGGDNY